MFSFAVAYLKKDMPDIKVIIMGDGPDLAQLVQLASLLRLGESVSSPQLYQAHHYYVPIRAFDAPLIARNAWSISFIRLAPNIAQLLRPTLVKSKDWG